eukprot:5319306-Amphidinium_carterae.1
MSVMNMRDKNEHYLAQQELELLFSSSSLTECGLNLKNTCRMDIDLHESSSYPPTGGGSKTGAR